MQIQALRFVCVRHGLYIFFVDTVVCQLRELTYDATSSTLWRTFIISIQTYTHIYICGLINQWLVKISIFNCQFLKRNS